MTDSIVWVKPDTAINLDSISFVQFRADTAKILFSHGGTITLDGKDSDNFAHFLRKHYREDTQLNRHGLAGHKRKARLVDPHTWDVDIRNL
jgi:hypothetical protein